MVNFDLITNMELRLLATASETMNALPDEQANFMIEKISALDQEGQKKFIQALRDERLNGWKLNEELGFTPEIQMKAVSENPLALSQMEKSFSREILAMDEKRAESDAALSAESAIASL